MFCAFRNIIQRPIGDSVMKDKVEDQLTGNEIIGSIPRIRQIEGGLSSNDRSTPVDHEVCLKLRI